MCFDLEASTTVTILGILGFVAGCLVLKHRADGPPFPLVGPGREGPEILTVNMSSLSHARNPRPAAVSHRQQASRCLSIMTEANEDQSLLIDAARRFILSSVPSTKAYGPCA